MIITLIIHPKLRFRTQLPLPQLKPTFAISLALLAFTPLQAQPSKPIILVQRSKPNSSGQLDKQLSFNVPPPPDDINAPSHRIGGGKRGCENIVKQMTVSNERPLTALAPVYGPKDSGLVFGLTTVSNPTFWFYIPYLPTVSAEFVLQDAAQQIVYQTPISLSGTPGVVSLPLPSTAPPLEIGKRYRWYFNIYCQPQQPPVFVYGWIKRDLAGRQSNLKQLQDKGLS